MNQETQPVKLEVTCPTNMYARHTQWCIANHAITTDDFEQRDGQETYTRVFADEDQARWFAFDMGVKL